MGQRYKAWTSAERGLVNFATRWDVDMEEWPMSTLVKVFCEQHKIEGSYSERILQISEKHYPEWKEFIVNKQYEYESTTV